MPGTPGLSFPWPWVLHNRDRGLGAAPAPFSAPSGAQQGFTVPCLAGALGDHPHCAAGPSARAVSCRQGSAFPYFSFPCPPSEPSSSRVLKSRFKQRAVLLNLAALFQPGGFGCCRLGSPHSYPNCLETLTFSRLSPFQSFIAETTNPVTLFCISSHVHPLCLPTAHLEQAEHN